MMIYVLIEFDLDYSGRVAGRSNDRPTEPVNGEHKKKKLVHNYRQNECDAANDVDGFSFLARLGQCPGFVPMHYLNRAPDTETDNAHTHNKVSADGHCKRKIKGLRKNETLLSFVVFVRRTGSGSHRSVFLDQHNDDDPFLYRCCAMCDFRHQNIGRSGRRWSSLSSSSSSPSTCWEKRLSNQFCAFCWSGWHNAGHNDASIRVDKWPRDISDGKNGIGCCTGETVCQLW